MMHVLDYDWNDYFADGVHEKEKKVAASTLGIKN
jgi:hypothetical protein